MVGRKIEFTVIKDKAKTGNVVLSVKNLTVKSKHSEKPVVNNVSFNVKAGEVVCLAGIDGNGQSELVYAITGLEKVAAGAIELNGKDITKSSIRHRSDSGMSHIPEDRHKHGLILEYSLAKNLSYNFV